MTENATQDKLSFNEVDLTDLQDAGVLMAANERFFWPLGLALTWYYDDKAKLATGLHVREWTHPEGEMERIDLAADDDMGDTRRTKFAAWAGQRIASIVPEERARAQQVVDTIPE